MENYTVQDLYKNAGKELADRIIAVFNNERIAAEWFYSPIIALGNRKPYECINMHRFDEKRSDVEIILERIEHGIMS